MGYYTLFVFSRQPSILLSEHILVIFSLPLLYYLFSAGGSVSSPEAFCCLAKARPGGREWARMQLVGVRLGGPERVGGSYAVLCMTFSIALW